MIFLFGPNFVDLNIGEEEFFSRIYISIFPIVNREKIIYFRFFTNREKIPNEIICNLFFNYCDVRDINVEDVLNVRFVDEILCPKKGDPCQID